MTVLKGFVWRVEQEIFLPPFVANAGCFAVGPSQQNVVLTWATHTGLAGDQARAIFETLRSAYAWRSEVEVEIDDDGFVLEVSILTHPVWTGTIAGPVQHVDVDEKECRVTIADKGIVALGFRFSLDGDDQTKRRAANAVGVLVSALQTRSWVVARHDSDVLILDFVAQWDPLWDRGTRFDDRYAPAAHTHEDLQKLASEVATLRDQLGEVANRVATLEGRTAGLEGALAAITTRTTIVENRVGVVENRTSILEGTAASLSASTTTLGTRTTALEGRATALEAAAAGLDARTTLLEDATDDDLKQFTQVTVDVVDLNLAAPLSSLDVAQHLPNLAAAFVANPALEVQAVHVAAGVWNGALYQRSLVVDVQSGPVQGPWPITLWDTRDAAPNPYRDPIGPPLTTRLTVLAVLRQ